MYSVSKIHIGSLLSAHVLVFPFSPTLLIALGVDLLFCRLEAQPDKLLLLKKRSCVPNAKIN